MMASFIAFYPKIALWTLFKVSSFCELNELFVFFRNWMFIAIFFTTQSCMHLYFTTQTIKLSARWTFICFQFRIELKYTFAPWRWTPTQFFVVFIHKVMESKLIVFLYCRLLQIFLNISCFYVNSAIFN